MNKTAIEWCDRTWNPVSGCFHDCPYCYARNMTHRFAGYIHNVGITRAGTPDKPLFELHSPCRTEGGRIAPYPFDFYPTLHRYRLNEPQKIKTPQNIFVCSMADLFGDWVPDEWVKTVLEACQKAPQHRYIFLTKNYRRYNELRQKGILPLDKNMYFGASVTTEKQLKQACLFWNNIDFLSIEPLSGWLGFEEWAVDADLKSHWEWVIIGAETGNRKGRVTAEREWVDDIVCICKRLAVPVFMKDSLKKTWGKPLIREYPWEETV